MEEILISFIIVLFSFFAIAFGAHLIVKTTEFISQFIKISSFIVSLVLLGFLTTTPEIGILVSSIKQNSLEISIGNLMGGIIVINTFIIPFYAIIKNGLNFNNNLERKIFPYVIFVCLSPFILIYDHKIDRLDALLMITLYVITFLKISEVDRKEIKYFLSNVNVNIFKKIDIIRLIKNVFLLIGGLFIVLFCSDLMIKQIIFISNYFQINSFFISLLVLSLGTNLPEISIMLTSLKNKYVDIALGNYWGSAITNVLFISTSILVFGEIQFSGNALITLIYACIAFLLLFFFFKLNNSLGKYQGLFIVVTYVFFFYIQLFLIK